MISEDRQLQFARVIVDQLYDDDLADYTNDDQALRVAKRIIAEFVKEEDHLDETVRAKLRSLKKAIVEGSSEWDTMFRKYYEEEARKRGT